MNSAFVPRKTLWPPMSTASTIAAMRLMRGSNRHAEQHRRERDRDQLRIRHGRRPTTAAVARTMNSTTRTAPPRDRLVELRPEEHERHAEDHDHERVVEDGAGHARHRALAAVLRLQRVAQRAQLLVLLAADHLVRADDLLAACTRYLLSSTEADSSAADARPTLGPARASAGRTC
jgi:hypothetical protein